MSNPPSPTPPLRARRNWWYLLLLILCGVGGMLLLLLPHVISAARRGSIVSSLGSFRQLYLACFQMANDGTISGNPELGWPGELARGPHPVRTVSDLMNRLITSGYLKPNEVARITSIRSGPFWTAKKPATPMLTFFKVYRVTASDGPNAIIFATRNFTYGKDLDPSDPFGDNGFIILHKGGDGAAYRPSHMPRFDHIGLLPGRRDVSDRPVETADDILEMR